MNRKNHGDRIKWIAFLISAYLLMTITVQTTLAYLIVMTPPVQNNFEPFEIPVGDLVITKNVEHPFDAEYKIPENIEFDFNVSLGAIYAGSVISTSNGDVTADDKGDISVKVKPGESVKVHGIDEKTKVSITENLKDNTGFSVKDGVKTQNTTIVAEVASGVDYINIYAPESVKKNDIAVTGTKILEGRDWKEGDTFSFLLERKDENNTWQSLAEKAIVYDAANATDKDFNKFSFDEYIQSLEFDKAGTYAFRVSEIVGELENVDYDKTINYFYIIVGDVNMDGVLEITDVKATQNAVASKSKQGKYAVDITFNNTFVPTPVGDLQISKALEHPFGKNYSVPQNLAFEMKVSFGEKYANLSVLTSLGEKKADVSGCISVVVKPGEKVDIFGIDEKTEAVIEELQKNAGFKVKGGEAIQKSVINANATNEIKYINMYTPDKVEESNVTITGTKILKGRKWQTGDKFSFVLEQKTSAGKWKKLAVKEVTFDADKQDYNKFDFNDIISKMEFDEVGTYKFRITEQAGVLKRVTYDKTVGRFDVHVTDKDMDGTLEVSEVEAVKNVKVASDDAIGKHSVDVSFTNVYKPIVIGSPKKITIPIVINKTVRNEGEASIGPEGFLFELKNMSNRKTIGRTSDEKGIAKFELSFDKEDIGKTFVYKVSEHDSGRKGVKYSDEVCKFKISISKNKKGKLIARVTKNGELVEDCTAEFVNIFKSDKVTPTPKTGDNNRIFIWWAMMMFNALMLIVIIAVWKSNEKIEKMSK